MSSTGTLSDNLRGVPVPEVSHRRSVRRSVRPTGVFSPVFFQFAADFSAVLFSYIAFNIVRYELGAYEVPFKADIWHIAVIPSVMLAYWLLLFWMSGLYRDWFVRSPFDELYAIARTTFWGCFALFILIVVDSENFDRYRLKIIVFWLILLFAVFIFRLFARIVQRSLRRSGVIILPAVVIGTVQRVQSLFEWIRGNPSWGYHVHGVALDTGSLPPDTAAGIQVVPIDKAELLISELHPQVVLISLDNVNHTQLLTLTSMCAGSGIRVKIVPDLYEVFTGLARTLPMYGAPLIEITTQILRPWQETAKRIFDIIFSAAVLLLGMPIWLLIGVAIRLESQGAVLFNQMRIGKNGKPFLMHKYRSMVRDSEKKGQQWTVVNDPRVTKFGRLLRKTHLDEIPQFWNVLKGEMSIVGPRPEQPKFVEKYQAILPYYTRRLIVRPGITGWWQVKYKAHTESVEEIEGRLRDDFYYIENLSLKLDFEILIRTVYCVVTGHGQA